MEALGGRPAAGGAPARYRILRRLGSGGTADVYLAEAAATGERVALKRMRHVRPDALLRLKREFRAVEHLVHPNLVRLHELGEDDAGLYVAMELVDGVDLLAHAAGAPRARLADALPQLLDALAFLHARGVVHGDLSPRNVLVRGDGVVKLLDFGLHALVGARDGAGARAAGTPAYVAPERIRGEPPTPASDLYSLGCVVFELLAGRPPFEGGPAEVIAAHLEAPAPPLPLPGEPRLAAACAALLAKDPAARPSLAAAQADLLAPLGARAPAPAAGAAPAALVGREPLQRRLRDELAALGGGDGRLLVLRGPSGVGKSALAGWLGDAAAAAGLAVLRGRARPSERIPFNAADGIVDDLAVRLGRAPDDAVRAAAAIATTTFPVLAAVADLDLARDRARAAVRRRLFGGAGSDPPPDRRAVFDAVARLVAAAGAGGGVLLVVDDVQWADPDAIGLLEHVLAAGAGRIGAALVVRDDLDPTPAAAALVRRPDARAVEVPRLDAAAIARILRDRAGEGADPAAIARAAAACGGLPVLAVLAGRHLDDGDPLGAAVGGLAADADPTAREVLALLAVAGAAPAPDELAALTGAPAAAIAATVEALVRRSLARWGADGRVELFHDAVRARVERALHADWTALAHERLARHLEARAHAGAERVRHLLGAGRDAEAAAAARAAAPAAAARHAYAQAAELYAIALGHPGAHEPELVRGRAEALEGCGRHGDAAACWRRLADLAAPGGAVEPTLREASARLGARQLAAGLARLDVALRALGAGGVRGGPLAGARAGIRFLRGPARPPRRRGGDAALAEQLVRAGEILGYFDTLAGIRVIQRAQDEFERAGAAEGAAWCDYLFALFARFSDATRRAPLSDRYRAAAEARLGAAAPRSPVVRAFPAFLDGYADLRAGRWDDAVRRLDHALAITTEARRTSDFEHRLALSLRTSAVLMTQDARAAEAAVARFASTVADTSDSAMQCHVVNARTVLLVLQGRIDEAAEVAGALAAAWPRSPRTVQGVLAAAYAAYPDLHRRRARPARRALAAALAEARGMRLLPSAYGPILATWAALAEALALREGDRAASPRRVARWAALAAGRPTLQTSGGLRARAYAADAAGDRAGAVALFAAAEREAARWRQPVDAAIAAYQRGRRLGGDAGAAAMSAARSQLAERGASARLLDEDPGDA